MIQRYALSIGARLALYLENKLFRKYEESWIIFFRLPQTLDMKTLEKLLV